MIFKLLLFDFLGTIMVKKKKGGVGKQRKPIKEKSMKEKQEDVPVNPEKKEIGIIWRKKGKYAKIYH